MCGIFGAWNTDGQPLDVEAVERAVNAMRHRGPDDEGYLLVNTRTGRTEACGGAGTPASLGLPRVGAFTGEDFDLVLGHRRLAVLDPSPAGHQPMLLGANAIVHSGEIYNFERLRSPEFAYRTGTDTEVLLTRYADDEEFERDLDGMWAFAIWDGVDRRLFCSRDRFGIKPFHYRRAGSSFVFASEIKGILAYDGDRGSPDESSVADYLAWGMSDHSDRSFFEGVRVLEPGSSMVVDAVGARTTRYWSGPTGIPIALHDPGTPPPPSGESFTSSFERSVAAHLRSDVPLGFCLSGGLDSSSILGTVARLRDERTVSVGPLRTFTAGFEDPAIDERRFAELAAGAAEAEPHVVVPDGEALLETLPRIVRHQEAPSMSSSLFAQWKVMELASRSGVTVLLDGQGGDELLSGYPHAFDIELSCLLRTGRWGRLLREASHADGGLTTGLRRAAVSRSPKRLGRVPLWMDPSAVPGDQPWRYLRNASLSEVMANDLRYRLPALLRYEERNSMAFGIESRVPFLGRDVVLHANALSDRERIRDGVGKAVLRDGMRGVVPDEILDRRTKVGFRTPEAAWLRANLPEARTRILDGRLPRLPFVRAGAIEGGLRAFEAGDPATHDVWRWLNLSVWFEEFFPA